MRCRFRGAHFRIKNRFIITARATVHSFKHTGSCRCQKLQMTFRLDTPEHILSFLKRGDFSSVPFGLNPKDRMNGNEKRPSACGRGVGIFVVERTTPEHHGLLWFVSSERKWFDREVFWNVPLGWECDFWVLDTRGLLRIWWPLRRRTPWFGSRKSIFTFHMIMNHDRSSNSWSTEKVPLNLTSFQTSRSTQFESSGF